MHLHENIKIFIRLNSRNLLSSWKFQKHIWCNLKDQHPENLMECWRKYIAITYHIYNQHPGNVLKGQVFPLLSSPQRANPADLHKQMSSGAQTL